MELTDNSAELVYICEMTMQLIGSAAVAFIVGTALSFSSIPVATAADGPTNRIVGGTVVNQNNLATPWYALLDAVIEGSSYQCGGTVISPRHIVTAGIYSWESAS